MDWFKRLPRIAPALVLTAWFFTGYQYISPEGLRFGGYASKVECEAARAKALKIHADAKNPVVTILPLRTAEPCELVRTRVEESIAPLP